MCIVSLGACTLMIDWQLQTSGQGRTLWAVVRPVLNKVNKLYLSEQIWKNMKPRSWKNQLPKDEPVEECLLPQKVQRGGGAARAGGCYASWRGADKWRSAGGAERTGAGRRETSLVITCKTLTRVTETTSSTSRCVGCGRKRDRCCS